MWYLRARVCQKISCLVAAYFGRSFDRDFSGELVALKGGRVKESKDYQLKLIEFVTGTYYFLK